MYNKQLRQRMFVGLFFCATALPLAAAEPDALPATESTPAFPAALAPCDGCSGTLDARHEITYVSRLAFPLGSALLTRDAALELLRMLVELESFAVVSHIEIIGHADPSGPENYNRWISEKRAQRVQDYFEQNGVDPRKTTIRGAGSAEPLVGAIDPSEHRRTEVRITVQPFLRTADAR